MSEEELQAKKEFTKLKRSATLLGIEYTEETSFEDLSAKVAEAKARVHLEELQEQADGMGLEYPEDVTAEQLEQLIADAEAKQSQQQNASNNAPAELPSDAHTYYVSKDGVFSKFFTNEEYKGDALKFAKQYAEEIGGEVYV